MLPGGSESTVVAMSSLEKQRETCFTIEHVFAEPVRTNFEDVYKLTRHSVYRFCRKLCGSREDAEDLVQQTYIKAFGALDRYEATRPVENWLFRIAHNSFIDSRRRAERRPMTISESNLKNGMESKVLVDPRPGPDEIAQVMIASGVILNALQSLDKSTQEIVREAHLELRPYTTIARERNLKLATLRSKLFRARRIMRKRMKTCETGECVC